MASDVRLTQAQKRDLLRMSGAAVVSTIFFGVPMLLGRPADSRLQMTPVQFQAAAPAPAVAPVPVEPRDTDVSVVFSEAVVEATAPRLERAPTPFVRHARQRQSRRDAPAAEVAASVRPQENQDSAPLAKRLGRLLTGSGRYEVRPFPTVGNSGS